MESEDIMLQKVRQGFASLEATLMKELPEGVYKDLALVNLELAKKNAIKSIVFQT